MSTFATIHNGLVKKPIQRVEIIDAVTNRKAVLSDVVNISYSIKSQDDRPYAIDNLPPAGTFTIECNNNTGDYTLDNSVSPFYGLLRSGNKVVYYQGYEDTQNIGGNGRLNKIFASFDEYRDNQIGTQSNSIWYQNFGAGLFVNVSTGSNAGFVHLESSWLKANSIAPFDRQSMVSSFFHFYNTAAGTTTYDDFNYSHNTMYLSPVMDISYMGQPTNVLTIAIHEANIVGYIDEGLKYLMARAGNDYTDLKTAIYTLSKTTMTGSFPDYFTCNLTGKYIQFALIGNCTSPGYTYTGVNTSAALKFPIRAVEIHRSFDDHTFERYRKAFTMYLDEPEVGLNRLTLSGRDRYSRFYEQTINGISYTADTKIESVIFDILNQNLGVTTSNFSIVNASSITLLASIAGNTSTTFPSSLTIKQATEEVMKTAVAIDSDGIANIWALELNADDNFLFKKITAGTTSDSISLNYVKDITKYIDRNKLVNRQYVSFPGAETSYPEVIGYQSMWTVNKDTFETTNTVALVPASPDIHSPIGAIRFTYTNSAQVLWYENDVSHDSAAMSRRSYNPSSGFAELKLTARNLTYDNISLFSATQTVTSTITVYVTPLTTTETISGASIYQASINSYGVRDGQELTSFLLKSNSLAQNMAQAVTKFKGQPLEKVELKMCNGTAMSAWGLNTVWSIQATSYGIPNWSNYIVTEINGTHSLNGSPNISGNIILTKVNT